MRFVVDKVTLVQVFLRVLQYSPVSIIALVLHFLLHFITSLTRKGKEPKAENVQTEEYSCRYRKEKARLRFMFIFNFSTLFSPFVFMLISNLLGNK